MDTIRVFETFEELLAFAERKFQDDPLFTIGNEKISFRGFASIVRGIAETLTPGNVYSLVFRDPVRFACAYYACVLSGAVAFLPPQLEWSENIFRYLPISDRDISLCESASVTKIYITDPNQKCTVAFSSGTTVDAKGVALSQKNLLMDTAYSIEKYRYWRHERILHVLPYNHLFGLVADLLAPLHAGAEVHFPAHPLKTVREVFSYQPDVINLPPAMIESLLSIENFPSVTVENGGALKKILCSGAALSDQLFNRLLLLGITPCTAYGMTECSPCVTITSDDDIHSGTVGKEIGCVDLKFSEENEILVSGDTIMLGYEGNEAATKERIKDGWLYTGDLGYRDDHGHIVLTGRKDNVMALPNGCNCSPELIEKELSLINGISECVIIQRAEHIYVVIVIKHGSKMDTESVRHLMVAHGIERYEIVLRDRELPKNQLGKVIRKNVI